MKQLSGLDASFLYMETPSTYGHVNGLAIYERPSPDFDPYQAAYDRFDALLGRLEPMRRRLVEVPFKLDHPYWIEDPDFDLDYHVRHLGLAPPGGADQLAEQVARIVGRKMDRSRPLWEAYVIEGLADGRWAMLTKTHHATIDGASGVLLLNILTDQSPDAPLPDHVDWTGEAVPSDRELLERTMRHLAMSPIKGMRLSLRMIRHLAEAAGVDSVSAIAGQARDALKSVAVGGAVDTPEPTHRVRIPLSPAPPTPFNRTITPHRRFAMRSTALGNIKALKDATGCTVNDVVMAICTGALREYLLRHDALPDQPLRAMVPVSIRTGLEEDPWTNRVGAIIADLPTHLADPLDRLRGCHDAMIEAKRQLDVLPADDIAELAQVAPPLAATAAMRLQHRLRLADRVNLPTNVVISNVPGPRHALYFAGALMTNYIPVSTITDDMGLNITVHSYLDRLDFGLISDRELVPDLWDLVDLHIDEIDRLFEATGAERFEQQPAPSMRRGSPKKPATKQAPAKQSTAKKSPTKKSRAKKSPAKKSPVKKSPVKKSPARKSPARKSTARRSPARTSTAKKAAAS
ncbi:MAG TPA: wax ester/triacylglycerol synthase family O-acyltransferase [Ilumatobacteraceae bacterium]|nr:wax ester/triacylglycerol synthase family O-acyltransferase [Ilumatobacteraceae bacterium]